MVPVVGLEPTRDCSQWILNPSRLPFHHTGVQKGLDRFLIRKHRDCPLGAFILIKCRVLLSPCLHYIIMCVCASTHFQCKNLQTIAEVLAEFSCKTLWPIADCFQATKEETKHFRLVHKLKTTDKLTILV